MSTRSWTTALAALAAGIVCCGCESDAPAVAARVQPVGDVKQTMTWLLDPAADVIWGSAGFVLSVDGERNLAPTTDEEWAAVHHAAAVVAEGGNLLLLPHLLPEVSDAGEYGQSEAAWVEFSNGMTRVAQQAMQAAEDQDAAALFEIGGHLYNVCRACHQVFARNMGQSEPTEQS